MVERGNGPAVVLVPGVQGRWEWMRRTVESLARRCRVVSFSLAGEPGSGWEIDPNLGFDTFLAQIDQVLDRAGVRRAVLCGVSYGGLIATRYAAHRRDRVSGLVLVSPMSPTWRPDPRIRRHCRAPRVYYPVFCAQALGRLVSEVRTTFDRAPARLAFALRHLGSVVCAPMSPTRASQRIRLIEGLDFSDDCRRVGCRTLIVTGEPTLDRVVPVDESLEYLTLVPISRHATLSRTGHLGIVTRPDAFAGLVEAVLDELEQTEMARPATATLAASG